MEVLYTGYLSRRRVPINLKSDDLHLFSHELKKKIPDTTLLRISNIWILRDTLFKMGSLRFFLVYSHLHGLSKKQKLKRIYGLLRRRDRINKAIWIIDNWSYAYFHWLTDALPRLLACDNFISSHWVALPDSYRNLSFVSESLNLLNVKYYFYCQNLFVKHLLLPSHTAQSGNYNQTLINLLRERFIGIAPRSAYRNIFISRRKAEKRNIVNELEVTELLGKYNFEVHCFEDYSLSEQINIMLQTKCLIGLHGAGLTNMLFMPSKGSVVELRFENDAHNNCFFSLASDLDHDYFYHLGLGTSNDPHSANLTVNIVELKQLLEVVIS